MVLHWTEQVAGYSSLDGERAAVKDGVVERSRWAEWRHTAAATASLLRRPDIRTPLLLLVIVILAQQCSGMKIIQGSRS